MNVKKSIADCGSERHAVGTGPVVGRGGGRSAHVGIGIGFPFYAPGPYYALIPMPIRMGIRTLIRTPTDTTGYPRIIRTTLRPRLMYWPAQPYYAGQATPGYIPPAPGPGGNLRFSYFRRPPDAGPHEPAVNVRSERATGSEPVSDD